jgi:hypothetical protein
MSGRSLQTTRRSFLGLAWGTALAHWLGANRARAAAPPARPGRSRVVLVRDRAAVDEDGRVDGAVLARMLDDAVASLLQVPAAAEGWKRLFGPKDVVGVKSNAWRFLPTPPELEEAVRQRLVGAGVDPAGIAIDDRGVLGNPVFARATAIVNVRPMRTHHWSGLGTCLKNVIMFVPRPSDYHEDTCASLGALWQLPAVAGKVRLNVLVMLTPQFHGVGPHSFSPRFTWPYRGLIVGTDPVAVDATGARVIAAQRRAFFGDDRPISPPPHHIQVADTRYGLGNSDPARIDIVRLGWAEEALI